MVGFDSGSLAHNCTRCGGDQIAALGPSAIVDQTEDLLDIWTLPKPLDMALDDEIAKVIRG